MLLDNLIDEERGSENHPELWMRFAEGMGNSRKSVESKKAMQEIEELVATFYSLSKSEQYHVGLAALYCYESMQPAAWIRSNIRLLIPHDTVQI